MKRLQGIHGRSNRPTGEQHIIRQNNPLVLNYEIDIGGAGHDNLFTATEIIPEECDIQVSAHDLLAIQNLTELGRNAIGEVNTPRLKSDDNGI